MRSLDAALAFAFVAVAGCGARSALEGQPDGAGGGSVQASATQANATASGSSSTGVAAPCPALRLVDPVIVAETGGVAREAGIRRVDNDMVALLWLGLGVDLNVTALTPFASWPPDFPSPTLLFDGVRSFALSRDGSYPSTYLDFADGSSAISYQLWPNLLLMETSPSFGRALYVANVDLDWLFGELDEHGSVFTRSLDFYTHAIVSEEAPATCSARPLGAAVRVGNTLLGAVADNRSGVCDVGKSWPDWLTTTRYDYFVGARDALVPGTSESWRSGEPFANLAMTPTSSGAWVVFQTDGSTSLRPPPITAYRIGEDARGVDGPAVEVSPAGTEVGPIGAVAMGDALAVAYVVNDRDRASHLVVQRVEPDGTLGPSVNVPTRFSARSERLDLVASTDAGKLLLGWGTDDDRYALARIDCAAP